MAYNWSSVTNVQDFLAVANNQTGGWFWVSMLAMLYFVLFISLLSFGVYPAILSASFAILVVGTLFVYMNLVGFQWLMFVLGVILLVFLWISYSSYKYNQ